MNTSQNNFLIATKTKKIIIKSNDLLKNVPRCDFYYKDVTNKYLLLLLKNIYQANECKDNNKLGEILNDILTDIAMIDFLLERFLKCHYINENAVIKVSLLLIEVKKMCYSWITRKIC